MSDHTTPDRAAITHADLDKAFEQIRRQASEPRQPDPIFVGDNFELAKALVEQGKHIICSSRVRTLLGEHCG